MTALSRRRMAVVFAALLAVFLLATLPLAAALKWSGFGEHGFSARGVSGSIWSGSVEGAAVGDAGLGNLNMWMSPLALLTGRTEFIFAPADASAKAQGKVGVSASSLTIDSVSALLTLPFIETSATIALQEISARFADDRCAAASGLVTADIQFPDLSIGGFALSGTAACEDGRLLLPLTGQTAAGDASLFLRIGAAGDYTYELAVSAAEPALQAQLVLAGFAADGGRYWLRGDGQL